ncbi:helix-turn-helix transcriptional regulator [Erysipelothrix sp. HDW6B]|uniref:helix-turn-helix domain-containing protein n=1 Tax=Erysipelothrix TaxID=1647 RepID=UPI00135A7D16|nr:MULTISPECIES: helix-turn-helix transcriptional regulator [Erysipelothrix]QIK86387.1 helix-turn-helix transcriptional regulator [Erysipelothrix sp. HDW6B]
MTLKPLISVIGEYVADELDKNNLTQRQFAKISGVSQATLVKIIRGDSKDGISTKSIDLLLKNTNTSMSELLNKYGEYK